MSLAVNSSGWELLGVLWPALGCLIGACTSVGVGVWYLRNHFEQRDDRLLEEVRSIITPIQDKADRALGRAEAAHSRIDDHLDRYENLLDRTLHNPNLIARIERAGTGQA